MSTSVSNPVFWRNCKHCLLLTEVKLLAAVPVLCIDDIAAIEVFLGGFQAI